MLVKGIDNKDNWCHKMEFAIESCCCQNIDANYVLVSGYCTRVCVNVP